MKMTLLKASDTSELKHFALGMMIAIPVIFCLILPWLFDAGIPFWPLYISASLALCYVFLPKGIYPFYRVWMWIVGILGWINTHLILALVFYLIFLPMGLGLRLFGKLQYQNQRDSDLTSYWIKRDSNPSSDDLERPF